MKLILGVLNKNLKSRREDEMNLPADGFCISGTQNSLNPFTNKSMGPERKNSQSDLESLTFKAG